MHTYIHTYVHTYIHTYMHTYGSYISQTEQHEQEARANAIPSWKFLSWEFPSWEFPSWECNLFVGCPPLATHCHTHYHLHPFYFVLFKFSISVAKQHPTNIHAYIHTYVHTMSYCSCLRQVRDNNLPIMQRIEVIIISHRGMHIN